MARAVSKQTLARIKWIAVPVCVRVATMTDRSFLGRGYENTAGKPFGYAWHQERAEIREHLKRRGRWNDARDEFTVTRIQERLHRNKPTLGERQAAWGAHSRAVRRGERSGYAKYRDQSEISA